MNEKSISSDEYAELIKKFDLYGLAVEQIFDRQNTPELKRFMITLLHYTGLAGEVGELGEKLKKAIRDKQYIPIRDDDIGKELGDIEWYLTRLESDMRFTKNEILQRNYDKLAKRLQENKLHGDGDNR